MSTQELFIVYTNHRVRARYYSSVTVSVINDEHDEVSAVYAMTSWPLIVVCHTFFLQLSRYERGSLSRTYSSTASYWRGCRNFESLPIVDEAHERRLIEFRGLFCYESQVHSLIPSFPTNSSKSGFHVWYFLILWFTFCILLMTTIRRIYLPCETKDIVL